MNGYERTLAMLEGRPADCLPLMPITMMFAADAIGVPYGRYATDYRLLVEGQLVDGLVAKLLFSSRIPRYLVMFYRFPL